MMADAGALHHGVEEEDTPLLVRPPAVLGGKGNDDHGNVEGRPRRRRAAGRKAEMITVKKITTNNSETFKLEVNLSSGIMESFWKSLKSQIHEVVFGTKPNDLKETRKHWSNYSLKALWFAIAMFSAYLDHSTSTSLTTTARDIFFVIAFVLFLVIDAALSILLMYLPYDWGTALVYISGVLLELLSCLLMVSFNPYYAFSILLVLLLIVAVALLQRKFQHRVDDVYLEHFLDLSQGIVNCGGLITAILGHYLVGQFNNRVVLIVGLFFFGSIVLGLYLMIVITVRVVTSRHAWHLATVLMALLATTLIISSIVFVSYSGIRSQKDHISI